MDFAQGLNDRVENKVKSKRSFNFTYGGGSVFPLSNDSSVVGLGYDYAVVVGAGRRRGLRGLARSDEVLYKSYVKQKQQSWENYAARAARKSSELVFNSVK